MMRVGHAIKNYVGCTYVDSQSLTVQTAARLSGGEGANFLPLRGCKVYFGLQP